MKILLIIPRNRSYQIMPSLGLGYIASVLRTSGHEVKILHCLKEKFSFTDFSEYIKNNDFSVIGIQMFTFDITPVKKYLAIIKQLKPGAIAILGGPHPSGDPDGVLKTFPDADFAFRGEVEIGLPAFLREIIKARPNFPSVPNLIWRNRDKIEINPIEVVDNLDEIPFPAWDLMDPRTYPEAPHGGFFKSFPTAPIIITRGCPMQCTFCSGKSVTTKKIRARSAENVIAEIKLLKEAYGANDFLIEDENFTLHRGLVYEFCHKLLEEKLNITWSCPSGVRLDTLDLDMLRLMEKSGCYSLSVGIEFGSQRIHDLTKKHLTIATIKAKIALLAQTGIKVTGFFMFGIPGETKAEMLETIKLAKELNIQRAQFNNFMPLPGSQLYDQLKQQGLDAIDYDHFFVHDVGFVPEGLTRREIKNLQRRAYLEFYLRPKILIGALNEITSFKQFYRLMKRFFDALR
ncbi:MAG: radical SAM protein [bacterium]|nr:radical SAM protein [bacterium]